MEQQTVVVKLSRKQVAWLNAKIAEQPSFGHTNSMSRQIARACHDAMEAS